MGPYMGLYEGLYGYVALFLDVDDDDPELSLTGASVAWKSSAPSARRRPRFGFAAMRNYFSREKRLEVDATVKNPIPWLENRAKPTSGTREHVPKHTQTRPNDQKRPKMTVHDVHDDVVAAVIRINLCHIGSTFMTTG